MSARPASPTRASAARAGDETDLTPVKPTASELLIVTGMSGERGGNLARVAVGAALRKVAMARHLRTKLTVLYAGLFGVILILKAFAAGCSALTALPP